MIKIYESVEKLNIFTANTQLPEYDSLLSNKKLKGDATVREYKKFEKGADSYIEYMTADEYMDLCSKYIFGGRDAYAGVITDKVFKYAEMMRNGDKFPLPYIDIISGGQEGRHRMLAGAEVFGKDKMFPVLIVVPTVTNEKEIEEYAKKAYPEYIDWAIEYVKGKLGMN